MAETSEGFGILPPDQRKSVRYCLRIGWRRVNWPVGAIIFGLSGTLYLIFRSHIIRGLFDVNPIVGWLLVPAFVAVIASPIWIAWLWWSVTVPKWRIWALRTVDDWPQLESEAIQEGLIWPRRSIWVRTEIKSADQRALEAALLRARDSEG